MVYIGSDDGNLYALNASTGANCGATQPETGDLARGGEWGGLCQQLSAATCNVYALNASTGAKLWSYRMRRSA